METTVVKETLSTTVHHVTDEDKALAHEFNLTARRALQVANRYLTHGPETARLSVVKSFMQALSRLSAIDTESELTEHRIAFQRTMSQLTKVIPNAIESSSSLGRVEDQDD